MPYKDPIKQRLYGKNHYRKHKTKYLASNKKNREALRKFVRELKTEALCADCGLDYAYYVMDFDHVGGKEALIRTYVNNNNRTGLLREIKKCQIVCSNCRRIRSYMRQNTY